MENYKLNNDLNMWSLITNLDWYNQSKMLSDDVLISTMLKRILDSKVLHNLNNICEMQRFVSGKRQYLKGILQTYFKHNNSNLTDEEYDWVSAHIVGLGEVLYDMVVENPDLIRQIVPPTNVNFEYIWDRAINELNA